jgi:acyl-[acyl-carrier-protein]-phospholipid O-acyltransferase/long-chain-fatty-acid--[acyl-carrier-protein] ligase
VSQSQFALLGTRRFLPLFATQFMGAFNDNVFKNALVILITYVLATRSGMSGQVMVTVAAGVFILPFFLFSATAGQLADRYDKSVLIRWIKLAEIGIMLLGAVGFALGSVPFLMAVLFLMGTQSTFFGPLKFGILPDHLGEDELIGGNALIEAGTFLAILIGTLVGGLVILNSHGPGIVSFLVLAVAVGGWVASLYIPPTAPASPGLRVSYNIVRETWNIIRVAASTRVIFLCILGISWFWLVGATFLAQFPTLVKDVIGANEEVVTLFLTVFSVGIGLGSLACNRLLKGAIHATYVPLGAVGITLFSIDLFFATQHSLGGGGELLGARAFLAQAESWRVLADLLLIAVSGGVYIVPLYALLQERSEPSHRARNIASNNVLNALFMVLSAVVTVAMLELGASVPQVFLTVALLNAGVAIYISQLLPGALVKAMVAWLLQVLYRVDVQGIRNYFKAGERMLVVANHQSFLDALLIAAYVPDDLTFAIDTHIAKQRFIRFFLWLAKTHPVDPTNPMATRALIEAVRRGEKLVIFPEGRITVTGSLMKVYEGPGLIADKAQAALLPVRIDGAQFTPFSRLRGKVRIRWFPKIRIQFLEPRRFDVPAELKGRKRRQYAADRLYALMTQMLFESSDHRRTLFQSLLDAAKTHGSGHVVLEDIERKPLSYRRVIAGSFILGRRLARDTRPGERVGVLLPNAVGTAITFLGFQAFGRVPAMLNFSTGTRNVLLGCQCAEIKTVYTSRRFLELARLEDMARDIEQAGIRLRHLEDVREALTILDKGLGLLRGLAPQLSYALAHGRRDPDAPAVVLFTSGTEGSPKGVVLTHANLQANRYQVVSRVDFGPGDTVFNALPMFHSFGLTCGTVLPLLSGVRTFLYPSPLHYRIVPELAYETNATIMFGTDTFLAGYARFAHPYDFYSMRYVFAGAERLKEETRRQWSEKFGIRILEGYGATETGPVLAVNTPMQNRPGSVGLLVPGMQSRLEPIPGIDEGGRLWVAGPNVMAGYLRADQPGVLQPPEDGWYDTGDIVAIDEQGYLSIKGRAKRFAKIGGEMVSLTAVEDYVGRLWPEQAHAVVSIPDPKKGEQLVLVTDHQAASREELVAFAKQRGLAELSIPKVLLKLPALPLLGSGKVDYVRVKALAEESFTVAAGEVATG